jgi:hypothetical protein
MNHPNSEPSQFPSAATPVTSSVYEKCSMWSDVDRRRNRSWEQTELESTTLSPPPPNYRYPRREAFTHSGLLRSAVLASIETSESCDDNGNETGKTSSLFDLSLQGKPSPLKRSRSASDMEEDSDSTENAFISKSFDMHDLSSRIPDRSTSPARVSIRQTRPPPN